MITGSISSILKAVLLNIVRSTVCAMYSIIGRFPNYHYKSLTPARVTQLLRSHGDLDTSPPGTAVTAVEWAVLEPGGIGVVYRIKLTYNNAASAGPKSLIVKSLGNCVKVRRAAHLALFDETP
jgi:hypothetical protein